jgi:hypothetical protein
LRKLSAIVDIIDNLWRWKESQRCRANLHRSATELNEDLFQSKSPNVKSNEKSHWRRALKRLFGLCSGVKKGFDLLEVVENLLADKEKSGKDYSLFWMNYHILTDLEPVLISECNTVKLQILLYQSNFKNLIEQSTSAKNFSVMAARCFIKCVIISSQVPISTDESKANEISSKELILRRKQI